MLISYLKIFFLSMLPIIEIRGALPVAQLLHLPFAISFIVAVIGNFLPVPFIYIFAHKILLRLSSCKHIGSSCLWVVKKGEKAGATLNKKAYNSTFIALLLFVGVPLPGTGAWTGALAASILNLGCKRSCWAIFLGILLAGSIVKLVVWLPYLIYLLHT